jgi:hypothetical protein
MTSEKWLSRIEKSLETEKGNNWTARLHLGASRYEYYSTQGYIADMMTEELEMESVESARKAWLESVAKAEHYRLQKSRIP